MRDARGRERGNMAKGEAHRKWLQDYGKASAWMKRHGDVEQLLAKGKGLAKVSNFLPDAVAKGVLRDLAAVPESKWNDTSASDDYTHNNISHSFSSVRHGVPTLDLAVRVISLLMPGELNSFSAARYTKGDNIAPHDDRAYTQVLMEDGSVVTASRNVACIYYLTKGWREQYGGLLVDLEDAQHGQRTYVPEWNSAILFRIPRWHQVTPMAPDAPPRFTVFGWFLLPGKRYKLNLSPAPPNGAASAPQQPPAAAAQPGSKKRRPPAEPQQQGDPASAQEQDDGQGAAARPGAREDVGDAHQQGQTKKKRKKKKRREDGGGGGGDDDDNTTPALPFPGPLALSVMAQRLGQPVAKLVARR